MGWGTASQFSAWLSTCRKFPIQQVAGHYVQRNSNSFLSLSSFPLLWSGLPNAHPKSKPISPHLLTPHRALPCYSYCLSWQQRNVKSGIHLLKTAVMWRQHDEGGTLWPRAQVCTLLSAIHPSESSWDSPAAMGYLWSYNFVNSAQPFRKRFLILSRPFIHP